MIRRREFITLLGGAAAWPLAARAQQGNRVRRIGVLMPFDENDPVANKTFISAFTQALAASGWTDGRNLRMDLRWAGDDINRMRALAQELVGLQPDIIVTLRTPTTAAGQQVTRTIPIVAIASEPVASGIVPGLKEPGGNVTTKPRWQASGLSCSRRSLPAVVPPPMSIASYAARSRAISRAVSDKIQDGREPQDRQGARSCPTPIDSAARRRAGRITAGYVGLWHSTDLCCTAAQPPLLGRERT
jgi:hypothetical protein